MARRIVKAARGLRRVVEGDRLSQGEAPGAPAGRRGRPGDVEHARRLPPVCRGRQGTFHRLPAARICRRTARGPHDRRRRAAPGHPGQQPRLAAQAGRGGSLSRRRHGDAGPRRHRAAGRGRGRARLSRDPAAALSVGRFRRPGRRCPALHAPGAARAGAGPSGRLQAQGAGLRLQPPADPRHAHCLAGHAAGGREEHRPVRQPCGPGRRRGRADRRFPAAECLAGAAYDACADRFDWRRIGHHLVQHLAKAERLSPTARRDASTFAAASRSAHLAAGR